MKVQYVGLIGSVADPNFLFEGWCKNIIDSLALGPNKKILKVDP